MYLVNLSFSPNNFADDPRAESLDSKGVDSVALV